MPPPIKPNSALHEVASASTGLASLALLSLAVGGASGLLGALFRKALEAADRQRGLLAEWAQQRELLGLLLLAGLGAAATMAAAWLVRRFSPEASGSGIPHVEAVLNHREPPAPACPWCMSPKSQWVPVEGKGAVHSYTEVHHAIQPAFKNHTPYLVLLVDLDTQKGKPSADEAYEEIR